MPLDNINAQAVYLYWLAAAFIHRLASMWFQEIVHRFNSQTVGRTTYGRPIYKSIDIDYKHSPRTVIRYCSSSTWKWRNLQISSVSVDIEILKCSRQPTFPHMCDHGRVLLRTLARDAPLATHGCAVGHTPPIVHLSSASTVLSGWFIKMVRFRRRTMAGR